MTNDLIRDTHSRDFAYAFSKAGIQTICKHVRDVRHGYVQGGYDFLEEPGDHVQLQQMMELAEPGDRIYVLTLRAFNLGNFDGFCLVLQHFEEHSVQLISLDEPDFDFSVYRGAIGMVGAFIREATNRQQELKRMLDIVKRERAP